MDFQPSNALTFGMELELQLVDEATGQLSPCSAELWRELEQLPERARYALEATRATMEVTSSIHQDADALEAETRENVRTLKKIARRQGADVRGGGTHILQFWNEREFTATDRAAELQAKYGFLPKRFSTYGMHVHIGVPGKEEAIQVANVLQSLCPLFIALSAASPFQQGVDTGFCAARPLEPLVYPYGGPMPRLANWAAFETIAQEVFDSGLAKSLKDIYWDVRPQPAYGTVEVRVFDTPLGVRKAVALAAFTRGCAALALHGQLGYAPTAIPFNTERVSRFMACRDGMGARLFNPAVGAWMPARQWLAMLVEQMQQHPVCDADLRHIQRLHRQADEAQDCDTMRATWGRILSTSPSMAQWTPGPLEYAVNSREHCARLLA